MRKIDKVLKFRMEYFGEIEDIGINLIGKVVVVMKCFGNYFKFCNNC